MTAIIEWVDEPTFRKLRKTFHDFKFEINREFPATANITIPITKTLVIVIKCDIQDSDMAWGDENQE